MAEDREIMREIWDGRIPVCFSISLEDVESEEPESVYLMMPRLSYFPLVTDKIQKHFVKYVSSEKQGEMWLEYEGQPLKWHYPIGLLFDLFACNDTLPWCVTVHFQCFPEEDLLHCSSKEVVESHFISTVKEADTLKHRGQVINSMQKRDHKQLWSGLLHEKFDQFWSVNKKLMESSGEDMFKNIPYRLYLPERSYIQQLFRPVNTEGNNQTLRDLLMEVVPNMWSEDKTFSRRVVLHGVEPCLDTPLLWMSEHLSYPDNYLHLCLLDRPKVEKG
ncbi:autophagy protein 5-like [Pecten maximus]|uniref:autophagy protein 5-like n=1 Tax=Pecten maximus TaxID=6579 RepID=UPI001458B8D1|nr:autophagy protein 5-like [Pecten maximus]XP_033740993.1 autophagy protein 5-like [Pecten maximus]XP_033740994.1 autophagy protein 5-like [Pecten maximus]XP_033740995.1 autophagy protein 5-like [Pecten maximus]